MEDQQDNDSLNGGEGCMEYGALGLEVSENRKHPRGNPMKPVLRDSHPHSHKAQ